jgi:hypothetical protein
VMLPLVSSYVFLFIVVPLLDVNATATTTLSTISTCHGGQLQQRNDLLMVAAVRSSVRHPKKFYHSFLDSVLSRGTSRRYYFSYAVNT